jgi:hypothetical protein
VFVGRGVRDAGAVLVRAARVIAGLGVAGAGVAGWGVRGAQAASRMSIAATATTAVRAVWDFIVVLLA